MEQSLRERNLAVARVDAIADQMLALKGEGYMRREDPEAPPHMDVADAWGPIKEKAAAKGVQVSDFLFQRAIHNLSEVGVKSQADGPPGGLEKVADALNCIKLAWVWILFTGEVPKAKFGCLLVQYSSEDARPPGE